MKFAKISALLAVLVLFGCSSVKIVPEQVVAGQINDKDNSQTVTRDSVSITLSPADPDMINYNIQGMVASFNLMIQNGSASEISYDNSSFILLDSDRRQYYPLTPEKIREMLTKDSYYLLPYPYVGFYYLEDYELARYKNSTGTNLPYYYERNPQDLHLKAFSGEPIIPGAKVAGLIYFNADISSLKGFTINIYRKGASKSAPPDFAFPFKVVR